MSRIKQHPQSQQLEQALLELGLRMRRQHIYRGLIQLTYTAFAGLIVFSVSYTHLRAHET